MKDKFDIKFLKYFLYIAIIGAMVLACAPKDDDDDEKAADTTIKVQGTVSSGLALTNTPVTIYDSNANAISSGCTSDDTGSFSCTVEKTAVSGVMLAVSGGANPLASLIVSESAPTANVTRHINPITDYVADSTTGVDASNDITSSSRTRRELAQILITITVTVFNIQITNLTDGLGVNATVFISGSSFVPRVDGVDNSGSVEDDLIETIAEELTEGNTTIAALLTNAQTTGTPLIADPAVQIRLASASLGRSETTATAVTASLSSIVNTSVQTSISDVFSNVAVEFESIRTDAQADATVAADNNLIKVALAGVKSALVDTVKNNSSALTDTVNTTSTTGGSAFVNLVKNMSGALKGQVISAVASAKNSSTFAGSSSNSLAAISTVVSNAAKQAGTLALSLNLTSTALSTAAITFLTEQTAGTFNSTVTTLTSAISAAGGADSANLTTVTSSNEAAIKAATTVALTTVQAAAAANAAVSGSVNANAGNIVVSSVTVTTVVPTTTTTTAAAATTTTSTTSTTSGATTTSTTSTTSTTTTTGSPVTTTTTTSTTTTTIAAPSGQAMARIANTINNLNARTVRLAVSGTASTTYTLAASSTASSATTVTQTGTLLTAAGTQLSVDVTSLGAGTVYAKFTQTNSGGSSTPVSVSFTKTNAANVGFSIGASPITLANSNQAVWAIYNAHSGIATTYSVTYGYSFTTGSTVVSASALTLADTTIIFNGTSSTTSNTVNLSSLGDGTVTLAVSVTGSDGVKGQASVNVIKDTTPPSGFSISQANSVNGANISKALFQISGFTISDTYALSVTNSAGSVVVTSTGTGFTASATNIAVNLGGLADGIHTAGIVLTDKYGNRSTTAASVNFYVDTHGPTVASTFGIIDLKGRNFFTSLSTGSVASIGSTDVIYHGDLVNLSTTGIPSSLSSTSLYLAIYANNATSADTAGTVIYSLIDSRGNFVTSYGAFNSLNHDSSSIGGLANTSNLDLSQRMFELIEGPVTMRVTIADTSANVASLRTNSATALGTSVVFSVSSGVVGFSTASTSTGSITLAGTNSSFFHIATTAFYVQKTAQMYMLASSKEVHDIAASVNNYIGGLAVNTRSTTITPSNALATTEAYLVTSNQSYTISVTIVGQGIANSVNLWTSDQWKSLFTVAVSDNSSTSAIKDSTIKGKIDGSGNSKANWSISTSNEHYNGCNVSSSTCANGFVTFTISGIETATSLSTTNSTWIKITLGSTGVFHTATTAAILLVNTTTPGYTELSTSTTVGNAVDNATSGGSIYGYGPVSF